MIKLLKKYHLKFTPVLVASTFASSFSWILLRYWLGSIFEAKRAFEMSIVFLVVFILSYLITNYIRLFCFEKGITFFKKELLRSSVRNYMYSDYKQYNSLNQKSFMTVYEKDIENIAAFLQRWHTVFIPSLLIYVLCLVYLATVHALLLAVSVICAGITWLMTHISLRSISDRTKVLQREWDKLYSEENSTLSALELIKTNNMEAIYTTSHLQQIKQLHKRQKSISGIEMGSNSISLFGSFVTMLTMIISAGVLFAQGFIHMGSVVTITTVLTALVDPIMLFDGTISALNKALESDSRIEKMTKLHYGVDVNEAVVPKAILSFGEMTHLRIQNVDFRYSEHVVLHHFSADFIPGQINLICGENGAGKSTLLKLIAGVYASDNGNICINDIDIQYFNSSLRKRLIAVYSQNMPVFPATILDNLSDEFRKSNYDEMVHLMKIVGIHDEIMAMPDQYQTILTEQGAPLSSGQVQRLNIAKALLRMTPIVILDEPFSSHNPQKSGSLVRYLEEQSFYRTIIIITHHPDILKDTRVILVNSAEEQ